MVDVKIKNLVKILDLIFIYGRGGEHRTPNSGFGGHQNLSSKIMKSSKTKEKNYFIH